MNELSETRLWKNLDSISGRLTGIESKLSEVVRLEERVNSHEQSLSRHENTIGNHDKRLSDAELWQASYGDKNSVERFITTVREEVLGVKKKVDKLESNKDIIKGQRDISKEVFKWAAGILATILIFKLTRG